MYFKFIGKKISLKDNLKKLDEIAKFDYNWNGYSADPIPQEIVEEVRSILNGLEEAGLEQPFIAPHPGGIQIEWEKRNGFYLEMHVQDSDREEDSYETFMCYWKPKRSDKGFTFEGRVTKDQKHINNLVKFWLGQELK